MKVSKINYTGKKKKVFRPFELTIKINNLADLRDIWHRFNLELTDNRVIVCLDDSVTIPDTDHGDRVFKDLDKLLFKMDPYYEQ